MASIDPQELQIFVEEQIKLYNESIILSIKKTTLENLLQKINPYLLLVENFNNAESLVKYILNARLIASKETKFGTVLESIARFVAKKTHNGVIKSASEGIDLEFINEAKYLVSIKSGKNWGNSAQIARLKTNFAAAQRRLKSNNTDIQNIICINGCCYGKDNQPNKGNYRKYCGQEFWKFISNDNEFYRSPILLDALKSGPETHKDVFDKEYANIVNLFTIEFSQKYCNENGLINYDIIFEINSGSKKIIHGLTSKEKSK